MAKTLYDHWSEAPASAWRWPSFSPQEIACRGTGKLMVDERAMDMLQALRDEIGKPMILNSAYRSPEHNRAVGGATRSKHLEGIAFDCRMDNHDPHQFEAAARAKGFTGFGYYPKSRFMHIDTGPARSWGTHWPKTATNWPEETPKKPEKLSEDKEAQAAAGAGAAVSVGAALEHIPAAGGLLGSLAPKAQIAAIVLAVLLIAYLLWKKGR